MKSVSLTLDVVMLRRVRRNFRNESIKKLSGGALGLGVDEDLLKTYKNYREMYENEWRGIESFQEMSHIIADIDRFREEVSNIQRGLYRKVDVFDDRLRPIKDISGDLVTIRSDAYRKYNELNKSNKPEREKEILKSYKKYRKMYEDDWDFVFYGIDSAQDLYDIAESIDELIEEIEACTLKDKKKIIDDLIEFRDDASSLGDSVYEEEESAREEDDADDWNEDDEDEEDEYEESRRARESRIRRRSRLNYRR